MENEELFWKYQSLIRKTRRLLVKKCRSNEELVADIEQEGAVGLIEAINRWNPQGRASLKTYIIYGIRSRMIKYLRYEKRNRSNVVESLENLLSDPSENPSEIAIRRIANHWLKKQLDALTDRQREVAICRYWLGLTNKETSKYLGTSHGRVSQLENEVKRKLTSLLCEDQCL